MSVSHYGSLSLCLFVSWLALQICFEECLCYSVASLARYQCPSSIAASVLLCMSPPSVALTLSPHLYLPVSLCPSVALYLAWSRFQCFSFSLSSDLRSLSLCPTLWSQAPSLCVVVCTATCVVVGLDRSPCVVVCAVSVRASVYCTLQCPYMIFCFCMTVSVFAPRAPRRLPSSARQRHERQ